MAPAAGLETPSARLQADRVLAALRNRDGRALAALVHPEKGVRFSPSAYVDVGTDRVFSAAQVEKLWSDDRIYRWGDAEGSGDPIELTARAYLARYALGEGEDFTQPTSVHVDDDRAVGSTVNNAAQVYPGAARVEFFAAGKQADGYDWQTLRLVFERSGQRWWLVGVIHDAWSP